MNEPSDLGRALNDVVEKTQLLVREEIELAKAEVSTKITKLIKGAVIGIAAGLFAVMGLFLVLHAASWFAFDVTSDISDEGLDNFWLGFLIVAVLLFLLGGLAGFLAARFIKKGAPPTPDMAIEEAQLIKRTYSAPTSYGESWERQR